MRNTWIFSTGTNIWQDKLNDWNKSGIPILFSNEKTGQSSLGFWLTALFCSIFKTQAIPAKEIVGYRLILPKWVGMKRRGNLEVMLCHRVILSLVPWTFNYYTNRQLQELNISLGLIKHQISATEPTEFTGHCLVLSLCGSCVQGWVCPGSVLKSQYPKPAFCLVHIILHMTQFVKRKGTAIFWRLLSLVGPWNSIKCNNFCILLLGEYWLGEHWVLLLVCRGSKRPFRLWLKTAFSLCAAGRGSTLWEE